jgi:hypothetical protein
MSKRLPVTPAPAPLEEYSARFDDLFSARAQREGFRRYLEGLLLPAERNKTLSALANTEAYSGCPAQGGPELAVAPFGVRMGCPRDQRAPP